MPSNSPEKVELAPHWHQHNPWSDHLIYVPLDELALCCISIEQGLQANRKAVDVNQEFVLGMWRTFGPDLDGYILTGKTLTGGVRYGPEPDHYLSPGFSLPKLAALLKTHRKT